MVYVYVPVLIPFPHNDSQYSLSELSETNSISCTYACIAVEALANCVSKSSYETQERADTYPVSTTPDQIIHKVANICFFISIM